MPAAPVSCEISPASGGGSQASLDVEKRRGPQSAQGSGTQNAEGSTTEDAEGCAALTFASLQTSNNVPVLPLAASLLGLLAFIGGSAFILVARKRRVPEELDFQI
jgi:hypothetical protein